jgi:hypothetical protein
MFFSFSLFRFNSHILFFPANSYKNVDFRLNVIQLDPAGWLPKCFVNRLNTKLVMIIENLRKLAQACPLEEINA